MHYWWRGVYCPECHKPSYRYSDAKEAEREDRAFLCFFLNYKESVLKLVPRGKPLSEKQRQRMLRIGGIHVKPRPKISPVNADDTVSSV